MFENIPEIIISLFSLRGLSFLGVQVVAGTTSGGNSVKFHTCARTYTPRKLTPVKYGKGFNFNTLGHS